MTQLPSEVRLRAIGALAALVSLAALLAHVFGLLAMDYFLTFFGVPSIVVLLVLASYARRIETAPLLRALVVGFWGGALATVAYDLVRAALFASRLTSYNGFTAIHIFGGWITRTPPGSTAAAIAGWIYHYWNGLSFGIFYALIAGPRLWIWGIAYGLLMEACMLGLFPLFLPLRNKTDFVLLSMLGHAVYGAVLGRVVQRYAIPWNATRIVGRAATTAGLVALILLLPAGMARADDCTDGGDCANAPRDISVATGLAAVAAAAAVIHRRRKRRTWVEIELADEDGKPMTGESYRITLPDGTVREGVLDEAGQARVPDIDPGSCVVTFPRLDQSEWTTRGSTPRDRTGPKPN
jgi:hypothetical protein